MGVVSKYGNLYDVKEEHHLPRSCHFFLFRKCTEEEQRASHDDWRNNS